METEVKVLNEGKKSFMYRRKGKRFHPFFLQYSSMSPWWIAFGFVALLSIIDVVTCSNELDDEEVKIEAASILHIAHAQEDSSRSKRGSVLDFLKRSHKLTILLGLMSKLGMDAMFNITTPFTLFAPSDEAFALLPLATLQNVMGSNISMEDVLLNHMIPSLVTTNDMKNENVYFSSVPKAKYKLRINVYNIALSQPVYTVNGIKITDPDLKLPNMVIHIIDGVLFPFASRSINDFLFDCDYFEDLSNVFILTEVDRLLEDPGPYTVFAPVPQAFSSLQASERSALRKNKTAIKGQFVSSHVLSLISNVAGLLYHIVPGTFFSEGVRDRQFLSTKLIGTDLQCGVSTDGKRKRLISMNEVRVVQPDIIATNGVIHLIEQFSRPDKGIGNICRIF